MSSFLFSSYLLHFNCKFVILEVNEKTIIGKEVPLYG